MQKKPKVSVAQYLEQQFAMSDKTQKEIADELGYDKPNMITMLKQGKTKLPINKIGPLAKALGIDPVHLLRLTLSEYMPETLSALDLFMGKSLVSQEELSLIEAVRASVGTTDLDFTDPQIKNAISDAVRPFIEKEYEGRAGAATAVRRNRAEA